MTSLAIVPEGLERLIDVALRAVPVLAVAAAAKPAGRGTTCDPSQLPDEAQSPAAARNTVDAAAKPSAGQVALVPVHFSATSQAPAAARHTVDDDAKPSAGQVALVPVQF